MYWVSHLFFVLLSFTVWMVLSANILEEGFIVNLFYWLWWFSMISAFPMALLSIAYIFYIHTMTDEMKNMMNKGMTPEEAYSRSRHKGWFKW